MARLTSFITHEAERLDSEQEFLHSLGIITFDPTKETPPDVLTQPTKIGSNEEIGIAIDSLHTALDSLVQYYSPQERAIGLAAPQLGLPGRVAIIQETDATRRVLIDPTIVHQSKETEPWRLGA